MIKLLVKIVFIIKITFIYKFKLTLKPQVQLKQEKETRVLLDQKLHSSVKPEESMWSLHKGECLQVGAKVCAFVTASCEFVTHHVTSILCLTCVAKSLNVRVRMCYPVH